MFEGGTSDMLEYEQRRVVIRQPGVDMRQARVIEGSKEFGFVGETGVGIGVPIRWLRDIDGGESFEDDELIGGDVTSEIDVAHAAGGERP